MRDSLYQSKRKNKRIWEILCSSNMIYTQILERIYYCLRILYICVLWFSIFICFISAKCFSWFTCSYNQRIYPNGRRDLLRCISMGFLCRSSILILFVTQFVKNLLDFILVVIAFASAPKRYCLGLVPNPKGIILVSLCAERACTDGRKAL